RLPIETEDDPVLRVGARLRPVATEIEAFLGLLPRAIAYNRREENPVPPLNGRRPAAARYIYFPNDVLGSGPLLRQPALRAAPPPGKASSGPPADKPRNCGQLLSARSREAESVNNMRTNSRPRIVGSTRK